MVTVLVGLLIVWSTALPRSPSADQFRGLVFAHRGLSGGDEPENTLAAIRATHLAGASAIEIDVHLTADGVPIALHDATLDRTTSGQGKSPKFTLARLRELNAAMGRAAYVQEGIPTIDEVMALTQELGIALEIDAKDIDGEAFAVVISEIIEHHDAFDDVFVSSFRPNLLYKVRSHDPRIITALAIRSNATGFALVDAALVSDTLPDWLGVGQVEPHRGLVSLERIENWRQDGFVLNCMDH